MSQSGYTPIQHYKSTTPSEVPVAGNLLPGELAVNIADSDMAVYMENASGVVKRVINNPAGLTYPTADGTADQVIKTDGAGNLSFTSAAASADQVSYDNTTSGLPDTDVQAAIDTLSVAAGVTYDNTTSGLIAEEVQSAIDEVAEVATTFRINETTGKPEYYDGTTWKSIGAMKKIASFPSSGTWTVPAGVTYAIAHIISGGGGGANTSNNATAGGDSSVGFASGTVSSVGGYAMAGARAGDSFKCLSGRANTGESATIGGGAGAGYLFSETVPSTEKVHGASVTPEEEITVTVGAGGAQGTITVSFGGTANGGSGYVWIEYYE